MDIEDGGELQKSVRELSATAQGAKLTDLTDFSWETVHVFSEGAPAKAVNAAAGVEVLREGSRYYEAGNLLIFTADGEFVKAVSVLPDVLAGGGRGWGANVRLEPRGSRTPVVLKLVEP